MSLFGDLDIAGAADNPNAIPDNTYACVVSKVEVKTNNDDNYGMYFTYTITDGQYKGKTISEYKRLPHPQDHTPLSAEKKEQALAYIKQRLASLNIPESRMNSVDASDLVGIDCYISTKQNGDYTNVRRITMEAPAEGVDGGTPAPAANPFANL